MASKVRRHRLLIYTIMLNRWWRATLAIGLATWILAAGLVWMPRLLPQYPFLLTAPLTLWLLAAAGGFALLLTILLAVLRRSAWVQTHKTHLQLATPFLRLNISYRRILRTYSAEVQQLFPPARMGGLRRDALEPIAARTALVLELTELPLPRWVLKCFLSPFFFPDRSPRLALIVPDWMALSTEVDSQSGSLQASLRPVPKTSAAAALLAGLKNPLK